MIGTIKREVDKIYKVEEVDVQSLETFTSKFPLQISGTEDPGYYFSRDTSIKQSIMNGCFGPVKQIPARLKVGSCGTDPMIEALKKVVQDERNDVGISPNTMEYLQRKYPRREVKPKVLSIEVAVNGIPGSNLTAIKLATSPGYPWNQSKKKGKSEYLTRLGDEIEIEPGFKQLVMDQYNQLLEGTQIPCLWADSLKDETRPREKVEAFKTRLISSSPLPVLIIMRMLFGSWLDFHMSDPVMSPTSIGINVHGPQWKLLYDRIKSKGKSIISGDFSAFDSTLPVSLCRAYVDLVNWWYDDGEVFARARHLLVEHLYNAEHIVLNIKYKASRGVPSGHGLTWSLNSIVGIAAMHHVLTNEMHIPSSEYEMSFHGDDNLTGVNVPGITCDDLTPHFERCFSMKYTHWSKHAAKMADTLESIRYIGRKFFKDRYGNMLAPLDEDVVKESLYWVRKGDHDALLCATAETFFLECAHFPQAKFNELTAAFRTQVLRRCPHLDDTIDSKCLMYSDYHDKMFRSGYRGFKSNIGPNHALYEPVMTEVQTQSKEASAGMDLAQESRNTQFTDRAANDLIPTQEMKLGAFYDVGPTQVAATDTQMLQEPHKGFNMERFDINGALSRVYELTGPVWNESQIEGTLLATFDFPDVLFAQPFIADKINDFDYFRAGVRFGVRVNCNQFVYGRVAFCWNPINSLDAYPPNTIWKCSQHPHELADASAADTVNLDCAFSSQKRALEINNYTAGEIGRISLFVDAQLDTVDGAAAQAELIITAQFLEPELFLPHSGDLPAFVRSKPPVKEETYVEVPISTTRVRTESGRGASTKESNAKSKAHAISSSLISKDTGKAMVKSSGWLDTYADTFNRYSGVLMGLGMLGLSKPTTQSMTDVGKINPYSDLNYGKGVDCGVKLAMDPENGISTQLSVGGVSVDEMLLTRLLGTPSRVSQTGWLATTPPGKICNLGPFEDVQSAIVDDVTRFFKYWQGSYKIKLYIAASQFHRVRMVLWISDSVDSATQYMNCYHRFIDIQGMTEVSFTTPYMKSRFVSTTASGTNFSLWAQVISFSTPDPAISAPVRITCYKAGASDFKVSCQLDYTFIPNHNPRSDFTMPFEPFQESMEAYDATGYMMGEEFETVREMVHRHTCYGVLSTSQANFFVYSGLTRTFANGWQGIEMWGKFYRFWRGSVRFKLVNPDSRYIILARITDFTDNPSGLTMSSPTNPIMEGEVPYYSQNLMESTDQNSSFQVTSNTSIPRGLFKSAGDDFSFHFIRGLPPGTLSYPNGSGMSALAISLGAYNPKTNV